MSVFAYFYLWLLDKGFRSRYVHNMAVTVGVVIGFFGAGFSMLMEHKYWLVINDPYFEAHLLMSVCVTFITGFVFSGAGYFTVTAIGQLLSGIYSLGQPKDSLQKSKPALVGSRLGIGGTFVLIFLYITGAWEEVVYCMGTKEIMEGLTTLRQNLRNSSTLTPSLGLNAVQHVNSLVLQSQSMATKLREGTISFEEWVRYKKLSNEVDALIVEKRAMWPKLAELFRTATNHRPTQKFELMCNWTAEEFFKQVKLRGDKEQEICQRLPVAISKHVKNLPDSIMVQYQFNADGSLSLVSRGTLSMKRSAVESRSTVADPSSRRWLQNHISRTRRNARDYPEFRSQFPDCLVAQFPKTFSSDSPQLEQAQEAVAGIDKSAKRAGPKDGHRTVVIGHRPTEEELLRLVRTKRFPTAPELTVQYDPLKQALVPVQPGAGPQDIQNYTIVDLTSKKEEAEVQTFVYLSDRNEFKTAKEFGEMKKRGK